MKTRAFAFSLALMLMPLAARADVPIETLMSSFEALGPARADEVDRYAHLERVLGEAERAEALGNEASAARHRELCEALLRGLESSRQVTLVRTQLEARRQALLEARAQLAAARERGAQAEADRERAAAGTR